VTDVERKALYEIMRQASYLQPGDATRVTIENAASEALRAAARVRGEEP